MKFVSFAQGKKTYAIVAIGIALGVAQQMGWHIPAWVDWALTFLGLGTLRMAVTAQSAKSAADIAVLLKTVLDNVTVPEPEQGPAVPVQPVEVHYLPPPDGAKPA